MDDQSLKPQRKSSRGVIKKEFRNSVFQSGVCRLQGVLEKKSTGLLQRWQTRHFTISGHYLKYFEKQDPGAMKGVVDLALISSVEIVKKKEIVISTPDGQLLLRAENETDAEKWRSELLAQSELKMVETSNGAAPSHHDLALMHEQYTMSEQVLGKGAFAVVKLATKKQDNSEWAVKCTNKSQLSKEDREDLYKEIKVLKLLGNHPCAVHMTDYFEDDSSMFIMMEYMKGGELFDRIVRKEKYTEGEARQLVKQVAHLLVYMHKHGIVHRDMKPENFLLTDESEGAQVKLADFGLAGLLDPSKHNLLFDACGTPGYVAPEVLEGKPYNEGVDLWALGVITYILLCGFPPFYNDNNAQLYAAIKECKYQFIRPYWDDVSDDAKDLIKQLMCRQKHRLSAADVLRHKWIVADGPHLLQELPSVRIELKKFNAKRKLRAHTFAVRECIALSKIAKLLSSNRGGAAVQAAAAPSRHDLALMHEQYTMSEQVLGKGAFAVVKLATKKQDNSEWAVKCTNKSQLSEEDREDLYKEIKVLKLLGNHPCAVHMTDYFEDDSSMFIMMEYMKGGELFDRIVRKEKYTEGEARQLVKQVAHLLVYMHKHGIVHRDMKPENFLLTDESEGAQVKLADFGLAGLLDPSKHNLLFDACGTPGYVAPEVLEGKPYNEGVDLWALGVITYILLCGFPPFYNDNNAQLYAAIKECKYQFIRPYWDDVSDDAKDLIKQLMCRQKHRLSAADVLRHKWIVADGPHLLQELPSVRIELKKFNAKRKLRAHTFAVRECIALSKIAKLLSSNRGGAAVQAAAAPSRHDLALMHEQYTMSEQVLGKGAFAVVKLATKKQDNSEWAVKCTNKSQLSKEDREDLYKEIKVLKLLGNHPCAVHMTDYFEDDSSMFIMMEYMKGGELFDRIVRKEKYTEGEARQLVKQVAHLLVYMHKHGIVHRDMKPENFLLTDESEGAQVKLADFGLAGLLDPSKHNLLFDACGTPGYVAPEVLEGKPYNEGVDLWALGVITYILLCGFPPFYNDNNAQLYAAIKECKYQFIRPYWDDVSDDAKDLIKQLMCRQKHRLSAADVLRHKWIVADGPHLLQELPSVRIELKKFNAKRKLRAHTFAVRECIALSKIAKLLSSNRGGAAVQAAAAPSRHDLALMHEQYTMSEQVLGKGAFAVVKLATKKQDNSEWAVKCTNKSQLSEEDREDLYKEIKVLKLLGNHPCAVHMTDYFEDDSSMFIMMEYMKGGELFDRIVRKEKYTEGEARQLVKQVAHLLVYMHKHGIVHRDMKPENFLLTDESEGAQVKLADFGLAGLLDPSKHNLLFDACGTPGYVAPEVLEGKPYNEGVDLWALGVITYILLCGFPPFYNDNNAQLYAAIKECKYQFIRPYWDDVSDDAKDLIKQLMCRQKHRLSAADVLRHKWIVADGPHLLQELPSVRIELKKFNAKRKLRAVSAFRLP